MPHVHPERNDVTHPNLQFELDKRLKQSVDENLRAGAFLQLICPDCTGTLKKTTRFCGWLTSTEKYLCLSCGRTHSHTFDDGA